MKFVEVKEIPQMARKYNNLQVRLNEFYTSNIKIVKIEFNKGEEYKSPAVAQRVIQGAAKRSCLPIRVIKRKDEVFLLRTDM